MLNEGAARAGRSRPPLVAHMQIAFTQDRATALQVGRQASGITVSRPNYRNMFTAAGFSQQDIETVSDSLVESQLIFGDESQIKDRLLELLQTEIDELSVGIIPVADAAQESTRLARLIGRL